MLPFPHPSPMTSRGAIPEGPASQPSAAAAISQSGVDEKTRAKARVGATINQKWRLDSLLGVGGMASVYAATHRNGSRAALKILHAEFARDVSIRDRFLREGYVANKIDHPGRVAILDDDITEQDEPFLIMELLEGETAQQLWKRLGKRVPVMEGLRIAAEVLDTLESFHAQGIVHRDLKPANIFITRENVVKLLDFGVARMREAGGDRTRAGTALGTPSFMAPEQAMGLAEGVDGRADLFSVGATLYALLSGQRLHQGRSDNEAFILAATTPAPSIARVAQDLPLEVIGLVDKALAWDRRSRFENATVMREECLRLMAKLGGPAAQPSPHRRRSEPAQQADRQDPQEWQDPQDREESSDRSDGRRDRSDRQDRSDRHEQRPVKAKVSDAAAHIIEEMAEEEEVNAEPDDPAVAFLVDVFRRLDRLLPAVRHYGWAHPEADTKLRATYQAIIEALRSDGNLVYWKLTPYAFDHRGQTVWEPTAPLDAVPYHLFAAGIRKIQFSTGFTEEELRAVCEVMLLDPATDLAPEDDVAARLWEKRLEHVRYEAINVFAEGDAADREAFWEETDDVEDIARRASEERANRVEAAAMIIETDAAAIRAARHAAGVLTLDPVAKRALGTQLVMTAERWSERFIDVVADAILNARRHKDLPLILEPLESSTRDLILQRHFETAFSMYDAIARAIEAFAPKKDVPAIKAEMARGVFTPETFRLLLREATRVPGIGQAAIEGPPVDLDEVARSAMPLMTQLGPAHLDVVMDVISGIPHEGLRRMLYGYLERTLPGREGEVTDRLMMMDLDVVIPILKTFATTKKPTAIEALRKLSGCANANLRCEAVAQLAQTPDQLRDDLAKLAESPQPELRFAALRAMARHQVKAAGPVIVRRIQDSAFHQLSTDERKELLLALYTLHPLRAEQVSIEILGKHGLITTDEAQEDTRALTADLMGRNTSSMEALQALLGATKRRWWNSERLRDKATVAAEAIAAKLGKRISPSGDVQ
jgi:eukaryotic-like serine/threonine-protein kinase